MRFQTSIALLCALGLAAAVPMEVLSSSGPVGPTSTGTAICGALDTACPRPTIAPSAQELAARGAGGITISVVNRASVAITTGHTVASSANGAPFPTVTSGAVGPGTIGPGETGVFAAPTGWAGTVFIGNAEDGDLNRGDASLIEASFIVNNGVAVADVDVSYVSGYTVPIVCACAGKVVTGCNKPLLKMSTCPNPASGNACANPLRTNNSPDASASAFFAPCAHEAYTYPQDQAANAYGECGNAPIVCCVGPECPAYGASV